MKQTFKVGDKIKFICTRNETNGVTIGKIYEVQSVDRISGLLIINDEGYISSYMSYRFELVVDDNSLEARIEKAKSLIGKMICENDGSNFIPDSWGIGNKHNDRGMDLDENGLVVYVENDDYISKVEDAELVTNVITLTDEYNAIIEKDFVKVGCQNIPIEKVRDVLNIWESLHG